MNAPRFWHGGTAGRRVGDLLLPPSASGYAFAADIYAKDLPGLSDVYRRDRVYVATDRAAAVLFASGHPDGRIYECEPLGILEPDPDCNTPGLSWACESARVIRVERLARRERRNGLAALFLNEAQP